MSKLYASPLRVYLCLGLLALTGIYSGLKLPVSLFPNSSKPTIAASVSYGDSTAEEFLNSYGRSLESQLRSINTDKLQVEKITADYDTHNVQYTIEFKWGAPPREAKREVENMVNSFGARFPKEIRDSISVWARRANQGFLAVSFYSESRSLDELYDLLEPILVPRITKVSDAADPSLWNPSQKEIRIELKPETMATLGLFPKDVEKAVSSALGGFAGGQVTVGTQQLSVQMPREASAIEDLGRVLISTPSGQVVHLSDVAQIDYGPQTTDTQSFKTSGAPSLILFAQPRPDGNVKRMAEEILKIVREAEPSFPKDVRYKVLVDPSEFIRSAVNNVFHEVLIGAALAVAVLFIFIGSFKNTVTAAIEIPLSMVLAFILMKLSGMNLNLISLGGLALSAGMNVDASVVVMENIFRHFESVQGQLSFKERLEVISKAVAEVRFSVIASTIASLVVFLPLAFTSDLSNAILGDLAKTVVFSHGFSAIVALILVPTVRLHLMSRTNGEAAHAVSPIEGKIKKLESLYGTLLGKFITSRKAQLALYGGAAATLVALFALVLPSLPREIIGTPDTDWMVLGISTKGNTLTGQMESTAEQIEAQLLSKFGDKIQYTFNQINGANYASLMARLKDKRDMADVWKKMEAEFANTPLIQYWVAPWNPAELPIPDPPHLRVDIRGGTVRERAKIAKELSDLLEENKAFPRVWSEPNAERQENIVLRPNLEQWPALWKSGSRFMPSDLADLARVATLGRRVGEMTVGNTLTGIVMGYPQGTITTMEDLASLPIGAGSKLVPIKALADVSVKEVDPTIYREDERELFKLLGKQDKATKHLAENSRVKSQELISAWQKKRTDKNGPTLSFEDSEKDLHEALRQLAVAVALSILLIFLTLVIQFGDVVNAALVLVAVPLGLIGVLVSLWVFKSTLSLNSILGVILLNGIAVANSIILVDFLKQLVDRGMSPEAAAVEAARKRLRPILITSLTTVLGMMPVALGFGEGGRILQPLGIAVSGGLWVSMGLTLFVVPSLQVSYLRWKSRHTARADVERVNRESVADRLGQQSARKRLMARFAGNRLSSFKVRPPEQMQ